MDPLSLAVSFWMSKAIPLILMVLGFGLLVFIHELGHFLVAKWVGINVQEFALGFGKRLWSFRRGETEYRLNVLPFGGYVKMLGQDDFHTKDSEEADPRAFNNRPIWARMCVVSAGVVLNIVLAAVLFVIVFSVGIRFISPEIGQVSPGYPADTVKLPGGLGVGLKPGDRMLKLNGKEIRKFSQLRIAATLSDEDETFRLLIQRPGLADPFEVVLGTESTTTATGGVGHAFGVVPSVDNVLGDTREDRKLLKELFGDRLQGGDRIVSFAGQAVEHGWQLMKLQRDLTAEPVAIVVEREDPATGSLARHGVQLKPDLDWSHEALQDFHQADKTESGSESVDLSLLDVLGLLPRMRVGRVDPKGPAAEAGIQVGDIVASYGEAGEIPTIRRFNEISKEYLDRDAPIVLLRDGARADIEKVRVGKRSGIALVGITPLYDEDHLVVAQVKAGTPLEGKIPSGATITAVNATPVRTWPELITVLADLQDDAGSIRLTYTTPAEGQMQTDPVAWSQFRFNPLHYGYTVDLPVKPLMGPIIRRGPLGAVALGVAETRDFILLTYITLRQFIKGRVSPKEFSGPVGILRAGVQISERGVIWMVWLLAIISANLAVINFLPLPIVDGGLMVFLLIERIRRRPLNVVIQNAVQIAGLVMIGIVFVLLTYNDIAQWIRSIWT